MRRPSFRAVIIGLFVVQILAACSVTAALAFANGRRAVRGTVDRLRDQVASRVTDHLTTYTGLPHHVNDINAKALDHGLIGPRDWEAIEAHCFEQMRAFPSLSFSGFANRWGEYLAIGRRPEGLFVEFRDVQASALCYHWLDASGRRGERFRTIPDYDARKRPWYRTPEEAGRPIWTPVYAIVGEPPILTSTATQPYYDSRGELVGILFADIVLTHASRFLRTLDVSGATHTFIVERGGELVASSSLAPVVEEEGGEVIRVRASSSDDRVIAETARFLEARDEGLRGILGEQLLELDRDGERQLVTVVPFRDGYGLDWLVVVVVPEDVYLGPIRSATRRTLMLCAVAALIAVGLAVISVRWISKPLLDLADKAHQIERGDLDVRIEAPSRDEIGTLASAMSEMLKGLRDRDFIRDAFGRYVTPDLVERFLADPNALELGGRLQRVTILMSDLRGFTSIANRLEPEAVVRLLNRYFGEMADLIIARGGMINEFLGDGVLALFGAPDTHPDDAERAVRAAVAMQRALARLNEGVLAEAAGVPDLPVLVMGVGIHSGRVVAGNIGGDKKVKYGVVGDAVNLAARIEGLTVGPQILISEETRDEAGDTARVAGPRLAKVKGRDEPLALYEVLAVTEGGETLEVPSVAEAPRAAVKLAARVFAVDGKRVDERAIAAEVVEVSRREAVVESTEPLHALSSYRLALDAGGGAFTSGSDVRAAEVDGARARFVFTFLHEEDRALIDRVMPTA